MTNSFASNGLQFIQAFVSGLMHRRELPSNRVTVMHRDLFAKCNVTWLDGQSMDALLSSLSYQQLRALEDALRDDDEADDE